MEWHNLTDRCVVGVFDSGIGGLNLLKECALKINGVDFIYVADNYAVPYGNKSAAEILGRVTAAFDVMADIGVRAAVVACNTATAVCIDFLRRRYNFPIIGIQPAVKQAAKAGGRCAVLCTEATAASASLAKLISAYGRGCAFAYACPPLAAYIEEHAPFFDVEEVKSLLPRIDADSLVLGCTHYTYIKKTIKSYYGLPVFDGMAGTADHLATILGKFDHLSKNKGKIHFIGGDICKNYAIFQHLMKNTNS